MAWIVLDFDSSELLRGLGKWAVGGKGGRGKKGERGGEGERAGKVGKSVRG